MPARFPLLMFASAAALACMTPERRPRPDAGDADEPPTSDPIGAPAPTPASPRAPSPVDAGSAASTARDAAVERGPDVAVASPDALPAFMGSGSCQGALVCEDFEGYAAGAPPPASAWRTILNGPAALSVDGTRASSGARSLKIRMQANGPFGQVAQIEKGAPVFPIVGNTFYGRLMMWISAVPKDPGVHWNAIQGVGIVPGTSNRAQVNYGGYTSGHFYANYSQTQPNGFQPADCWRTSKAPVPEQRWVCLEWFYDGSKDEMRLWVDGAPLDDVTVIGKGTCLSDHTPPQGEWKFPTFSALHIGWQQIRPTAAPVETWIDDVAVDTKRIGCRAPRAP